MLSRHFESYKKTFKFFSLRPFVNICLLKNCKIYCFAALRLLFYILK